MYLRVSKVCTLKYFKSSIQVKFRLDTIKIFQVYFGEAFGYRVRVVADPPIGTWANFGPNI